MSQIFLDVYGIRVEVCKGGGVLYSDLRSDTPPETEEDRVFDAQIDAIEALILGHACAGVDISTPAYLEGIESAVEAVANHA